MNNRLEEIKNEHAVMFGCKSWNEFKLTQNNIETHLDIITKLYVFECVKASLEKASHELFGIFYDEGGVLVRDGNRYCDSITNPENIVLL